MKHIRNDSDVILFSLQTADHVVVCLAAFITFSVQVDKPVAVEELLG